MSHSSTVKGPCQWQSPKGGEPCRRRAKVELTCQLCELAFKGCNFHRERFYGELQEHIRLEHRDAYQAALKGELYRPPPAPAPGEVVVDDSEVIDASASSLPVGRDRA